MNTHALIPVQQSVVNSQQIQTVNARRIHEFLGVKKDFADWIKVQINRAKLVENRDYIVFPLKGENLKGGRPTMEYHLTLRAGEHVSMMSNTEKGVEVRDYFIECEERAKSPVSNDPIIMIRMEQIAMQQQLQTQQAQIAEHDSRFEAMTPRLTASAITTILGAISHTAKIYRQAQAIKHIKVSVPESTEHFRLLLHDKYGVADIGYLSDIKAACKYLQTEAKRYQTIINEWYSRNNLFTGGVA